MPAITRFYSQPKNEINLELTATLIKNGAKSFKTKNPKKVVYSVSLSETAATATPFSR